VASRRQQNATFFANAALARESVARSTARRAAYKGPTVTYVPNKSGTYGSSTAKAAAASHQAHIDKYQSSADPRKTRPSHVPPPRPAEFTSMNEEVLRASEDLRGDLSPAELAASDARDKAILARHTEQRRKMDDVAQSNQDHNNEHVGATAKPVTGGERGNPYHDRVGKFTTKSQAV
jgi:hypothetical protein